MLVELMNGVIIGFFSPEMVLCYSMKLDVYEAGFLPSAGVRMKIRRMGIL